MKQIVKFELKNFCLKLLLILGVSPSLVTNISASEDVKMETVPMAVDVVHDARVAYTAAVSARAVSPRVMTPIVISGSGSGLSADPSVAMPELLAGDVAEGRALSPRSEIRELKTALAAAQALNVAKVAELQASVLAAEEARDLEIGNVLITEKTLSSFRAQANWQRVFFKMIDEHKESKRADLSKRVVAVYHAQRVRAGQKPVAVAWWRDDNVVVEEVVSGESSRAAVISATDRVASSGVLEKRVFVGRVKPAAAVAWWRGDNAVATGTVAAGAAAGIMAAKLLERWR